MGTELMLELEEQDTEHICASCEDKPPKALKYMQEVFLFQVVQPDVFNGQIVYEPVLERCVEQDGTVSHAFIYEPYYFCFSCWESTLDSIREWLRDVPEDERQHNDAQSDFACSLCRSGIRAGEYAGTYTLGECHRSTRAPNGIPGSTFVMNGHPELLCIYCLTILNDNAIELWDNGIAQIGECRDCTQLRCWRHSGCTCACHYEFEIYEDQEDHEGLQE